MTTTEIYRIRQRWRDQLSALGVPDPLRPEEGATPAGLARRLDDVSARIVILPADPRSTPVEFDDDFWEWWNEDWAAPFGKPLMWHSTIPTVNAAVRLRSSGDRWTTYMAIHRHGGIEVGTDGTYTLRDQRCFHLIHTVGLLWLALGRQAEVLRHIDLPGPWLIVLAMRGTGGAFLGGFGEGWAEPFNMAAGATTCWEPNVIIREEMDLWPTEPDEFRELAFQLGGRIEDAWGSSRRRFLDYHGDLKGEFNPRHWDLGMV